MRRLVVLLALPFALVPVPAARAQPAEPGVVLRLVDQSPWNDPRHTDLALTVRAVNRTDRALDDLSLTVTISTHVGSRSEYELSLRADVGSVLVANTTPFSGSIASGETRSFHVPPTDLTDLASFGATAIYPMKVELRSHDTPVATLRSPVIFLENPSPLVPLDLTWTFDLAAPIVTNPDGSFRTPWLQRQVAHGGPLRAETEALSRLVALPSPPAFDVAIAPQLLDQLGAMRRGYTLRTDNGTTHVDAGRGGAAGAERILRELRSIVGSSNVETSALPYASPSVPALVRAGLSGDLTAQLSRGRDDVESGTGVAPATGILHPPGSRLDQASLFALHEEGIRLLLVDDNTVSVPQRPNGFAQDPVAQLDVGASTPMQAVVPDPGVESLLSSTLPSQDPHLAVQSLLGELAAIWLEQPSVSRGVAFMLSERVGLPGYFYAPMTQAVEAAPWLRPMKASAMAAVHPAAPEQPAELIARPGPAFSDTYLADLTAARHAIGTYRSTIRDDTGLPDELVRDVLLAEAGQFVSDETLGEQFLAEVRDTLHTRFGLIAPDRSTIQRTLTSRTGRIPISIVNGTGHPARVQVDLVGGARLVVSDNPRMVVVPASGITLVFNVQARTTGRFPVQVVVRSPDGTTLSQARFVVRSTAYNRIALVITLGAALFLLALWARRFVPWTKR